MAARRTAYGNAVVSFGRKFKLELQMKVLVVLLCPKIATPGAPVLLAPQKPIIGKIMVGIAFPT
jgi:hypothetical protein